MRQNMGEQIDIISDVKSILFSISGVIMTHLLQHPFTRKSVSSDEMLALFTIFVIFL
mgnify:CR=1 FL=1